MIKTYLGNLKIEWHKTALITVMTRHDQINIIVYFQDQISDVIKTHAGTDKGLLFT